MYVYVCSSGSYRHIRHGVSNVQSGLLASCHNDVSRSVHACLLASDQDKIIFPMCIKL